MQSDSQSMRRLERAITTWVKNRVLIRVARGIYQVNPLFLGAEIGEISPIYAQPSSPKALLPLHVITRTATMRNDTQNTSETHEDALEGASEQEQVQEHQ